MSRIIAALALVLAADTASHWAAMQISLGGIKGIKHFVCVELLYFTHGV